MQLKRTVVNVCIEEDIASLNQQEREPIDTLVSSLESKLSAKDGV
jgi:hypothetical protein